MTDHRVTREIPIAARRREALIIFLLAAATTAFVYIAGLPWVAAAIACFGIFCMLICLKVKSVSELTPAGRAAHLGRMRAEESAAQAAEDRLYSAVYKVGFIITWIVTFVGSWIYCAATYGYLLGVGLGWLPSLIVATIIAALWPLLALAAATFALYIWRTK